MTQAREVLDRLFKAGIGEPVFALGQVSLLVLLKFLSLPGTGKYLRSSEGKAANARVAAKVWGELRSRGSSDLQRYAAVEASDALRKAARMFGPAFGAAMRDARIDLSSADALADAIAMLDLSFPEDARAYGDLFDELLSSAELSGRQGQLVTPRALVNAMVETVQPGPSDHVLDPAAGTAGFLVAARSFVRAHGALRPGQTAPIGYGTGLDTDAEMVRIGAVNLLLHGDTRPQMHHWDGLRVQLPGKRPAGSDERPTVVLSNPPLAADFDVVLLGPAWLDAQLAGPELQFVEVCRRRIGSDGRGAVVVPLPVLFGSSEAHTELRARLLDEARVVAVATLPVDTFPADTGAQAAVLVFDALGPTRRVWFTELEEPAGLVAARAAVDAARPLAAPDGWWSAEADEIGAGGSLLPAQYAPKPTAAPDDLQTILAEIVAIEDDLRQRLERLAGMLKR